MLPVYAQHPHPAFKAYTVEDGLASSEIYQVKQDSKGYIWFATGNGVSRFNGYEFENFSISDGLPDNTVFEIYEDHLNRIWFLPLSCKLSYYHNGKIYQYKYNDTLQKIFNNPFKTSFCVDKQGTIFIGINGCGIYEVRENGKIIYHQTPDIIALNVIQSGSNYMIYAANNYSKKGDKIKFNTEVLKGIMHLPEDLNTTPSNSRILLTRNNTTLFSYHNKLYIIKDLNT